MRMSFLSTDPSYLQLLDDKAKEKRDEAEKIKSGADYHKPDWDVILRKNLEMFEEKGNYIPDPAGT